MDSNGVQIFRLDFKETMGGALKKLESLTHGVFGGIDKDIAGTQRNLNNLGNQIRVKVDTSELRQAKDDLERVSSTARALGTSGVSTGKIAGGAFVGNLASQGVMMAAREARSQLESVFDAGMMASKLQAEFKVLAGELKGKELFGDLTKYIQDSIFGTELYGDAKMLLSLGVAVKNIMPDMKMLGDIAMGDKVKMEHLALAYGQITATGHLMGQDLNQMIQGGGFNPLKELERTTGKKYEVLKDMIEAGKVSAGMVRGAMVSATSQGGLFYHMLDNIGTTPFGKKQAMEGNIDAAKQGLGLALLPEISHVMDEFKPLIDELPADLHRMEPAINSVIHGFADMVNWTSHNTETLGKLFGIVKVGVEAWAAWKVGTAALTAANWLWTASIGATTTETLAATTAIGAENAELIEQGAIVDGLGLQWAAMGAAQKAAMLTAAEGSFALKMQMGGVAAGANASAAGLAGGMAGVVSKAAIPVAIAYFMGEALEQMMPRGSFGSDENGKPVGFWDVEGRLQSKMREAKQERQREQLRQHPTEYAYGWNMNDMLGAGGMSSGLLNKYGIKVAPATPRSMGAGSDDTDAITGGGRKQVIMNNYAPLYKVDHQVFQNLQEHIDDFEAKVQEGILRFLAGANAATG